MGRIQKAITDIILERKKIGKLSQRDVARALGCSQASVSQLLTGARGLSETKIEAFCQFLGITLGDLENPTPQPVVPKPLRNYVDKLKRLYNYPSTPGFRNVTRSIDDWLAAAKEIASVKESAAESNIGFADFVKPLEIEGPQPVDYSDPRHEHDEPREEIYEDLPFFDEFRVPAGKPDEVTSDGTVSVRKIGRHLAKGSRYVIRVRGDSMEPRIQDGDLILVDYSKEPRPGQVVIALVNDSAVVKKFLIKMGSVVLRSANPRYADIEIRETDRFRIAGVVLRIVEGSV